ncbi:hypothetical protein BGX34_001559 [Mortierella sp. NVP85]|nr:hypothetical protein BGX34_001559 [Mortierella sp. NVP85]
MIFSTLSKASLVLIVACSLLLLSQEAESHSWVECLDWKFKDPKKWSWLEKDGRCEGYPRQFPVGEKPFGKLDSNSPHRHFEQKHDDPDSQPACSNGKNGRAADTFDESLKIPYEKAYEGKSREGKKFGRMTVKKAGDRLCIRWPAKNHQYQVGATTVYIGISGVNPTRDPTQKEFISQRIAELGYNNCAEGSEDLKPCGACFMLPSNLQVGYYAVQWRWSPNVDEWYTSCADIKIIK